MDLRLTVHARGAGLDDGAETVGEITGGESREQRGDRGRPAPALERRLAPEPRRQAAAVTWAALEATIEALGEPCLLLREPGHVLLANAAARRLLRAAPSMRRELWAGAPRALAGWLVRRLTAEGRPDWLLAAAQGEARSDHLAAGVAAKRWLLTERQRDVLALAAAGKCNKEIAAELGCAARTVELHVSACLGKAGCASRAELVAKAWS
jgi:DNA-binding CsgD family transcriptional regulator